MLAIKAILADKDQIDTLIFDEIDTGISGRTAQKVSEKMAVIGQHRQVLCITHLPQIAAMALRFVRVAQNLLLCNKFCLVVDKLIFAVPAVEFTDLLADFLGLMLSS